MTHQRTAGRMFALILMFGSLHAVHAESDSRYLVLGERGIPVARVITTSGHCPMLNVDGKDVPMQVRALPATIAQRPTKSSLSESKPSEFPVLVCEAEVARDARELKVAGQLMAAPKKDYRRIVVIGDTGCRMKTADNAYQACNDPSAFPFEKISNLAAAWKPDLVVHVGDYHYRENPCPEGNAGCKGSPWGYGWDAWSKDFFAPGAALLQAAPLALVRGNHESCTRAGQGWWRMLDPRPLQAHRDCNVAADDEIGDYSEPFAIPLGGDAQLIIFDSSNSTNSAFTAGDARRTAYANDYRKIEQLTKQAKFNILANHHPVLGFASKEGKDGRPKVLPGNGGLQSAFGDVNPMYFPSNVQILLSGHVHLWENVSFSSEHPTQFVAGFSGTQEDPVPLPAKLEAGETPAKGAEVEALSSWVNSFGFMTMERTGEQTWLVELHDLAGKVVNTCHINGRHSNCLHAVVE